MPSAVNLRYYSSIRDGNPYIENERHSPSYSGFHTQLDCKLTYGNKNQTQLSCKIIKRTFSDEFFNSKIIFF